MAMLTVGQALDLALQHHRAGNQAQAEHLYRAILQVDPHQVDVLHLLGLLAYQAGQYEAARTSLASALCLQPDCPEMHNDLGVVLKSQEKLEEAAASLRQALRFKPDYPEAYMNLGVVLKSQAKFEEAAASLQQALRLKPDYAEAHNNLGTVLQELGKFEQATASLQQALRLKPDFAEAHNNLGNVFCEQGDLEEAVARWHEVLRLKPDCAPAHSNLLDTLHYRAGVTLAELAQAHADFERRHAAPLRTTWQPHRNDPDPDRPLRLGFLSPDLGRHPVGYFLIRAVEHLDPSHYAVLCYSNRVNPDELTARFRTAAAAWHDVAGWSDAQLAEHLRADRIDVLFDLAGHTAKNHLLIFARKPAPIQISWIGYEGTTGLAAMDYLLADRHLIPPEAEVHYHERVLRLPDGYVCYEPPGFAPPVSALPAQATGQVTFGSFNNRAKLTPQVIAVWAQLLERVPGSRLVLKYRGLDDPTLRRRMRQLFAGYRIDPARVEYRGWSAHAQALAQYGDIDVALDPFPFNGGVTTCEALWMGVPVVTCPGETFASRHSLSYLSTLGLTETIAGDLEEYVERAVTLAGDLDRLAALRARLRGRMATSPLCDGKRFAANLQALLRDVWRQWAAQKQ
jgi:predicted O-linked N-acetylglucosamine transferase (SPINDLY family)